MTKLAPTWNADETKRIERIEAALKRAGFPVTSDKPAKPAPAADTPEASTGGRPAGDPEA